MRFEFLVNLGEFCGFSIVVRFFRYRVRELGWVYRERDLLLRFVVGFFVRCFCLILFSWAGR